MEFLPYAQIRRALHDLGVEERLESDRMSLVLRTDTSRPGGAEVVTRIGAAAAGPFCVSRDRLGQCVERVLHRAHIGEFALIPAMRWRPILDAIAFDLASNQEWLEVDADASLHQNTREPLVMTARCRPLARAIIESMDRQCVGRDADLIIAALDAPIVMEYEGTGSLTLRCPENLAAGLSQHAIGT